MLLSTFQTISNCPACFLTRKGRDAKDDPRGATRRVRSLSIGHFSNIILQRNFNSLLLSIEPRVPYYQGGNDVKYHGKYYSHPWVKYNEIRASGRLSSIRELLAETLLRFSFLFACRRKSLLSLLLVSNNDSLWLFYLISKYL